jgi:hypothetical protein
MVELSSPPIALNVVGAAVATALLPTSDLRRPSLCPDV